MILGILKWLGLTACILLVYTCFMPWTFHADIDKTFTGFYSYNNHYGKPGILLTFLSVIVFVFMLLPKVWAKRANLFICALTLGYAVKTYVLFASCYNAYCPEKKTGLYLMIAACCIMLLSAVFPDMKIRSKEEKV
jgi:hypothetical protein